MIFAIRGKLMRTVPVSLHSKLVECLQMILKYRNNAKVTSKNPFLFGIPSDNKKRFKYLRACVLLRTFAEDCGAKLPHSLRGIQLRKHIATCCISLNLSEDEVTDLANFMGHDKRIHKSHYRQPIPELEILRTTQFLEAAQGGAEEENEEENEEKNEEENFNDSDYSDDNGEKNNNYDNESDIENEKNNTDISFQNDMSQEIHTSDSTPVPQTMYHNVTKLKNSSINKFIKKQHRNIKTGFSEKDISANNKKRRSSKYLKYYTAFVEIKRRFYYFLIMH